MDYKTIVYIIVKPPSKIISAHKVGNKSEYDEILQKAKQGGNCLYYAETQTKNGKQYAKQPWTLDPSSVIKPPEVLKKEVIENKITEEPAKTSTTPSTTPTSTPTSVSESLHELVCDCGKKCSSKSGFVLHQKICPYSKMLAKQLEPEAERKADVLKPESAELSCPFCGKKISSTPGRTLHVKNAHNDKLDEYYKWLKQHGKN